MKKYLVTIRFGSGKTVERLCYSLSMLVAIHETVVEWCDLDDTEIVLIKAERQKGD